MNQLDLIPKSAARTEEIPLDLIRRRPTLISAVNFAITMSGLEDKQVYGEVGIDSGAFSKMRNGTAWFPQDERFIRLLDVVHSDAPLIWLAEKRGYDWRTIRKHRSDTERRLEAVERENADLRRLLGIKLEIEGRK